MEAIEKLPNVKGATPLQVRLAKVYADTANPPKTHTEALVRAGYSPASARSSARDLRERSGIERASTVLEKRRLDSAGGLKALGLRALSNPALVDELEARDRLAFGLQCLKTANELGEEQETGDRARYIARRKLYNRRMLHLLGVIRAARAQDVVVETENASHNVATETVEISLNADAVEVTDENARFTYHPLSDTGEADPPQTPGEDGNRCADAAPILEE